jgi:hypothetical protein
MKVTRKDGSAQQSLNETIVAAWRALERPWAGGDELILIQQKLADESISPAAIARVLAREGVELRHPEVINCDARWREAQLEREMSKFARLDPLPDTAQLNLKEAGAAIAQLERLRSEFAIAGDETGLDEIKTLAIDSRQTATSHANDSSLAKEAREVQAEIAEWLRVWLETPNLSEQWLELRKASSTFRAKFPDS